MKIEDSRTASGGSNYKLRNMVIIRHDREIVHPVCVIPDFLY